jgi:c-di-GMP-binding flagellar brake protein YcgR
MAADVRHLSIHDEVTIETDIDGKPESLRAFVTNVVADEMWMATRLPEPRLSRLAAGQNIHVTFDRGGALVAESVFLRRLGDVSALAVQKSRVFAVRRPEGVESAQRRAHVRVDLERTVRIRSVGDLGADRVGKGRTLNIGAGGLLFVTDMPLLFGEELKLALVLTSHDIVVAQGPIVRIEDADGIAGPHRPEPPSQPSATLSKVAVRFDAITEADQERITCHILSAHRQRRRVAEAPEGDAGDTSEATAAEVAAPVAGAGAGPAIPEPGSSPSGQRNGDGGAGASDTAAATGPA